jgi:lipid A 3-O-deacylase
MNGIATMLSRCMFFANHTFIFYVPEINLRMKPCMLFSLLFFLSATVSSSQEMKDTTTQVSKVGFVSHQYENDVFQGTDNYYTQGVHYELVFPYLRKSPTTTLLLGFRKDARKYYGVSLIQECYTPSTIKSDFLRIGDRPYAAVLFAGSFLVSNDELHKQRLKSELDLGLTGHCALCDDEQKIIHRAIESPQPKGWDYQIRQDIVVDYSLGYDKGMVNSKYFDVLLQSKVETGTLYDRIELGAMIRTGKMYSYFQSFGPGENGRHLSLYAFMRGWVRGVVYDATMEGGVFDRNTVYVIESQDIERVVCGFQYGVCFQYRKVGLEYSNVFITPEFRNGMSHAWGHLTIAVAF